MFFWCFQIENKVANMSRICCLHVVSRCFVRQPIKRLKHKMEKKDMRYRCIILMNIKVACLLYKLAHASHYLQCNEFFIIGKSTVHLVLCEFMHAMNKVFKNLIQWAQGNNLFHVMEGFKEFSRMSSIQRAIDVFQIHIPTPKVHPL